jgi:8-oxo-dGTP pyrophosphatase MutT (NUDIX family)
MTFSLRRPAARVVLLDRDGRILLIRAEDPIDPYKPDWLEIPGGGMGWNEDSGQAALRELHEETGIPGVEMGPCVWVQQTQYQFAGYHFESDDRIHVAWCDGGAYNPQGLEALEAAAFLGADWWSLEDLLADQTPTVPVLLRDHLPGLVAGDLPTEPIDITPPPEFGGRISSPPADGHADPATPDRWRIQ